MILLGSFLGFPLAFKGRLKLILIFQVLFAPIKTELEIDHDLLDRLQFFIFRIFFFLLLYFSLHPFELLFHCFLRLLVITVFVICEFGSFGFLYAGGGLFGTLIHVFIIDGLFVFHRLVVLVRVDRLDDILLVKVGRYCRVRNLIVVLGL